jgi:hypothetical protein
LEPGPSFQGSFNLLCDGPYDEDIDVAMREFDADKRAGRSRALGQKLYDDYRGVMLGTDRSRGR